MQLRDQAPCTEKATAKIKATLERRTSPLTPVFPNYF